MSKGGGCRLLIVDDEPAQRDATTAGLERAGFVVRMAADAADGLTSLRDWAPDCILVDVVLPRIGGLRLLPVLRNLTDVPIIALTAPVELEDPQAGLDAGADDYLARPFNLSELVARVLTALSRSTQRRTNRLIYADVTVDLDERTVHRGEREIELSTREFDLLVTFVRRPQRVFTRDDLLDLVWGRDSDKCANTVETYISHLRAKLERAGDAKLFRTIRGVGYALKNR